ncbi:U2 small nuclear ribonucleoprotein auxiliary factor 35 kDa subunit-related protein 2 isoform X1 [Tachysurus vachellii]|uniref:U2 small nuclear ribonucleoprotein auxiliary factor 35 kDa subunit-related protein 2 isoform X1 n=1 Tax=Tachysurus vachellii TaxID=175792 RepID=UPI00296ADCC6|nr:U2 small nuclear ribonucleoprotein auxiliary factor 35 kDa subunit-related protein 2 isoform X1 [Tachysurus vachellii]
MLSTDPYRCSTNDQFPVVLSSENQHEVTEIQESAPLSSKQRRACLKRERRKRKRQALAKLRQCGSADQNVIEHEQDDDEDEEQRERECLHREWLERERIAQEEFRLRKEKEDTAQKKKEEEERRIREEWEEQQRKEREKQEQKQQEKRDREEAVQKLLDQAESQLENGGSWKNPDAPVDFGTEKDKANCPFFIKTGACRFGDRCSRKHDHPSSSSTLMVRAMFVTFAMEQSRRDDYDTDASLEYSDDETRQQFLDFYEDVLPEFRNAGKVVQFKVSCNFEPHLRGNVYVQYDTEEQCKEAFMMFNGRWYAGRQLQCEFSPVTKWKTAICGLYDRRKCPKGKHCNFLHVFQNPGNEFWEADRDLHLSSDRGGGLSGRHRASSQRGYSPEQSRYRQGDRWSHRSREGWSSRSRERRSRSRERRSRSRDSQKVHHSQRRERFSSNDQGRRSRSRERRRSRTRSRERNSQSGRSCRRSESHVPEDQIKNGSIKRKTKRSESKSPKMGDASSADNSSHHKRSKKSKSKKKKKSKKKQKRKRSKSSSVSSSAASAIDSGDDEVQETPKNEDVQKAGEDAEVNENMKSVSPEDTEAAPASFSTESVPD